MFTIGQLVESYLTIKFKPKYEHIKIGLDGEKWFVSHARFIELAEQI
jgi:hypothetical protein